ncbi:MAG: DNA-binding protein [Candidatus Aenigmarchaeota archaeon]|nr:DNA-binding protein [Candidatus Aenigmarchaeota archaeon]
MFRKIHVFRIKPEQDLLKGIMEYCREHKIKSGVIVHIIGSLKYAKLGYLKKLPGNYIQKKFRGPLEIVNGQGTIAVLGDSIVSHVHVTLSDENRVIAGHMADENIVFSTAEVVLIETKIIEREKDDYTGLNELKKNCMV